MSDNNNVDLPDDLDAFAELLHTGKAPESKEEKVDDSNIVDDSHANDQSDSDTPDDSGDGTGDEADTENREDTGDDKDDESEAPKLKGKKKSAQERIDEVVREKHETHRALQAALAEIEKLKTASPESVPAPELENPQPTADDRNEDGSDKYPLGEFDPQLTVDLSKWSFENEMKQFRIQEQQKIEREAVESAQRELTESWEQKLVKAEETIPDIRERGGVLEDTFRDLDPQYGQYLAVTIMSLDNGPEVLAYLSDNPDEARSIVALGPVKATLALGGLEKMFAKDKSKKPAKVTAAPEPPTTVNRGTDGRFMPSPDTDDLDDFEKLLFQRK